MANLQTATIKKEVDAWKSISINLSMKHENLIKN